MTAKTAKTAFRQEGLSGQPTALSRINPTGVERVRLVVELRGEDLDTAMTAWTHAREQYRRDAHRLRKLAGEGRRPAGLALDKLLGFADSAERSVRLYNSLIEALPFAIQRAEQEQEKEK